MWLYQLLTAVRFSSLLFTIIFVSSFLFLNEAYLRSRWDDARQCPTLFSRNRKKITVDRINANDEGYPPSFIIPKLHFEEASYAHTQQEEPLVDFAK